MKIRFFGTFNEYGYRIFKSDLQNSLEEVCAAGNSQFDSTQVFEPGSQGTIGLYEIEACCNDSGREIAKENNAKWLGCEYDETDKEEMEQCLKNLL